MACAHNESHCLCWAMSLSAWVLTTMHIMRYILLRWHKFYSDFSNMYPTRQCPAALCVISAVPDIQISCCRLRYHNMICVTWLLLLLLAQHLAKERPTLGKLYGLWQRML